MSRDLGRAWGPCVVRRHFYGQFILVWVLCWATFAALAPARATALEIVTMPFDCTVDGPRIILKPSEPRGYAIQGGREERQVTTCKNTNGNDCRTLKAHRFQILCGGRRVSWMRVVAAVPSTLERDIWVDAGRLHLALERKGRETGCRVGSRAGSRAGSRRSGLDDSPDSYFEPPLVECLPWDRNSGVPHIVLPAGFAPLGDFGARIRTGPQATAVEANRPSAPSTPLPTPTPTPTPIAPVSTPQASVSEVRSADTVAIQSTLTPVLHTEVVQARVASADVIVEPLSQSTSIPAVLTVADASRSWVTLVRPEPASAEPVFASRSPSLTVWLMALMLAAMMAMFARTLLKRGLMRPRLVSTADPRNGQDGTARSDGDVSGKGSGLGGGLGEDVRAALRKAASGFGASAAPPRPAETSLANAAASVSALIEQANGSLGLLSSAPPLREVLEQEIGVIQQRLAIVKAQASDGPEAAHKAAPAFRTLVRDLERVRRISESAALSFSADHSTVRLPRNKSEAYGILGVNAEIGDATLKKLVDALRVCWHPDLAKNAADLALREERIKIINVAWDLINGRRAPS